MRVASCLSVRLFLLAALGALPAAAQAPDPSKPAEEVYKNIQVMKGAKAGELIDAMRFMSDALGVNCAHCHVTAQQGPWPMEKDDKRPKQTTRKMITMTAAINKENFNGRQEVTCATCHMGRSGHPAPFTPVREWGEAPAAEGRPLRAESAGTPAEILDRYLQQLGGKEALEKLQTRSARGTVTMEQGRSFPFEYKQKAPGKYVMMATTPRGAQTQAFNGSTGWATAPEGTHQLHGLELAHIRRAAEFYPTAGLRERYPDLRPAPPEKVDGRDTFAIEARNAQGGRERLYFDRESGLLVRRILYSPTPFGPIAEEIAYSDYKEVDGVKLPFTVRRLESGARWTEKLEQISHNTPLDDAQFEPKEK